MDIKIYEMNIQDLEELSSNLILDFDDFWNYDVLKQEFFNETSCLFVAKNLNDTIVGFASVQFIIDEACISNIVTKKNSRNQGIGSALLKFIIDYSKHNNMHSITLEVNVNNSPALSLYKNFGFEQVGLRKNYYNGTDDAIIMSLNL